MKPRHAAALAESAALDEPGQLPQTGDGPTLACRPERLSDDSEIAEESEGAGYFLCRTCADGSIQRIEENSPISLR
jgi:hypothetical protein